MIGFFGLGMILSAELLAVPLADLFVGYDPELMELTVSGFRIFALSFGFMGFASIFENGRPIGRERVGEGILPSVAGLFLRDKHRLLRLVKKPVGVVKEQGVPSLFGHAHPIIAPLHGSEVAYEQQIVPAGGAYAHKAEDAPVGVVAVDPLKAAPVIVPAVKGGVFFIQMQKITEVLLKVLVERLL